MMNEAKPDGQPSGTKLNVRQRVQIVQFDEAAIVAVIIAKLDQMNTRIMVDRERWDDVSDDVCLRLQLKEVVGLGPLTDTIKLIPEVCQVSITHEQAQQLVEGNYEAVLLSLADRFDQFLANVTVKVELEDPENINLGATDSYDSLCGLSVYIRVKTGPGLSGYTSGPAGIIPLSCLFDRDTLYDIYKAGLRPREAAPAKDDPAAAAKKGN